MTYSTNGKKTSEWFITVYGIGAVVVLSMTAMIGSMIAGVPIPEWLIVGAFTAIASIGGWYAKQRTDLKRTAIETKEDEPETKPLPEITGLKREDGQ